MDVSLSITQMDRMPISCLHMSAGIHYSDKGTQVDAIILLMELGKEEIEFHIEYSKDEFKTHRVKEEFTFTYKNTIGDLLRTLIQKVSV